MRLDLVTSSEARCGYMSSKAKLVSQRFPTLVGLAS